MMADFRANGGSAGIVTNDEIDNARTELKTAERVLVEQETGGFALLKLGTAFAIGAKLGGKLGGTTAAVGAAAFGQAVKRFERADAEKAVEEARTRLAELEVKFHFQDVPTVEMPPMWRRDP
jgi:hypothetical protein